MRFNGNLDWIIELAGRRCGINSDDLKKMLPTNIILYINPGNVTYVIENIERILYDEKMKMPWTFQN
jgi:hypothetical protein